MACCEIAIWHCLSVVAEHLVLHVALFVVVPFLNKSVWKVFLCRCSAIRREDQNVTPQQGMGFVLSWEEARTHAHCLITLFLFTVEMLFKCLKWGR